MKSKTEYDRMIEKIVVIRYAFTSGVPIYLLTEKKKILRIKRKDYNTEKLNVERYYENRYRFNLRNDVKLLLTQEEYEYYKKNKNDPEKLDDVMARLQEETPYRYALLLANFLKDNKMYSAIGEEITVSDYPYES